MSIGSPIGRPIFGRTVLQQLFRDGAFSIAGTSTPAFTGATFHDGALSAAGTSTPAFTGESFHDGVLNAAGVSTPAFVGEIVADGTFSMAGTSPTTWVGASTHDGAFSISGTSTPAFYSAFRIFTADDPSSTTVTGLQQPASATLTQDGLASATDGSLIRDPFTWG